MANKVCILKYNSKVTVVTTLIDCIFLLNMCGQCQCFLYFQVWVRKGDGSKTKLYIGQLQKGKYKIKKS